MTIKKGDTGQDVKEIQEALGILADGIFGHGTEKSVKEFQTLTQIEMVLMILVIQIIN